MATRAGKLRHLVTIQKKSVTRDGYGEKQETWSTLAKGYAAIENKSGSETFNAGQEVSQNVFEVQMRFVPCVTAEMRVLYGSRVLEIQSVTNVEERSRNMILTCKETK